MKKVLLITIIAILSILAINVFATSDYEAEVLSDLSIIQGDPDGNMRYEDTVSRAECAKIVVAASKYRDLVDKNNKRSAFKDVTAEHWAAPYVTVGVKYGIFKGYFDATFRPDNTVTYEEAITMLLSILDYTADDIGNDWPYDQVEMGKKLGMLDGVTKSIGQKLTRRDISKLVYNTLNAKPKNSQSAYISAFERFVGPLTVNSADWYEKLGADSTARVIRDGSESSILDVKTNDIAYYMVEYNKILVYSKKITGIYENASPNKDTPVSVTVSGVTYNIEGDDAYSKLSSSGKLNFGDTVTLLIGKSGDVAGVAEPMADNTKITGFLSAVGTKETNVSGTMVAKPYIRIVSPSGEFYEFTTEKNYKSHLNRVVTVTLENGLAKIGSLINNYNVSGDFIWGSGVNSFSSYSVASDIKIIEVSTTESDETATVATVYPQRLNGFKLTEKDVLYVSKNASGNINELILKDVTGDMHTYGVITNAENNSNDRQISGKYEYLVDGAKNTLSTNGKSFIVSSGQAVKIKSNGREITQMMPLNKANSTKIKDVNGSVITTENDQYILSDKVQIYAKNSYSSVYSMITLDELAKIPSDYLANIYTDAETSAGGRVRIIVLLGN